MSDSLLRRLMYAYAWISDSLSLIEVCADHVYPRLIFCDQRIGVFGRSLDVKLIEEPINIDQRGTLDCLSAKFFRWGAYLPFVPMQLSLLLFYEMVRFSSITSLR